MPYDTFLFRSAARPDEEIQSLLSEMFNIAESYNCSMEADIYEVGGQQRSW